MNEVKKWKRKEEREGIKKKCLEVRKCLDQEGETEYKENTSTKSKVHQEKQKKKRKRWRGRENYYKRNRST